MSSAGVLDYLCSSARSQPSSSEIKTVYVSIRTPLTLVHSIHESKRVMSWHLLQSKTDASGRCVVEGLRESIPTTEGPEKLEKGASRAGPPSLDVIKKQEGRREAVGEWKTQNAVALGRKFDLRLTVMRPV